MNTFCKRNKAKQYSYVSSLTSVGIVGLLGFTLCCAGLVGLATTAAYAQKKDRNAPSAAPQATQPALSGEADAQELYNRQMRIYALALRYGDYTVGLNALYTLLADDPENIGLRDSIATLYLNMGGYRQAILFADEVLSVQPDNRKLIELSAICHQNLGNLKESLAAYERLQALTGSVYHLYQIAMLQFQLKRMGECQASLEALIRSPEADKEKVTLSVDNNRRQQVVLKSAAYNLLGVLFREQKEYTKAQESFQAAKAADATFVLPDKNIEELKKLQEKK